MCYEFLKKNLVFNGFPKVNKKTRVLGVFMEKDGIGMAVGFWLKCGLVGKCFWIIRKYQVLFTLLKWLFWKQYEQFWENCIFSVEIHKTHMECKCCFGNHEILYKLLGFQFGYGFSWNIIIIVVFALEIIVLATGGGLYW